ncbi:unnamed protein product [Auanema sp. JU1783]|nr:unnamed protein product [Auanema sp. JU1783]
MALAGQTVGNDKSGVKKLHESQLDILAVFTCPICLSQPNASAHSEEKWDLLLLSEHIADVHLGGFSIYNCDRCEKKFVSESVACFHKCKSDEFKLSKRSVRDREKNAFLILQKTLNDAVRYQIDSLSHFSKDTVDRGVQIEINPVSRSVQTDVDNSTCTSISFSHLDSFFSKYDCETEDKSTETISLEEMMDSEGQQEKDTSYTVMDDESMKESCNLDDSSNCELGVSRTEDGEILSFSAVNDNPDESNEQENEVFLGSKDVPIVDSSEPPAQKETNLEVPNSKDLEKNEIEENSPVDREGSKSPLSLNTHEELDSELVIPSVLLLLKEVEKNNPSFTEPQDFVLPPPASSPTKDLSKKDENETVTSIPLSNSESSQETISFDANGRENNRSRRRRWDVRAADGEPVVSKVKKSLLPGLCVPSLMDAKLSPLRNDCKPSVGEWTALTSNDHTSDSVCKSTTNSSNPRNGRNPSSSTTNSNDDSVWQQSPKSGFFFNNPFLSCYNYGSNVTEYKKMQSMQSRVQALVYQSVIGGSSDRPEGEEPPERKPYESWRPGFGSSSNNETSSDALIDGSEKPRIVFDEKFEEADCSSNSENYSSSVGDEDRLVIDESDGELKDVEERVY